MAYSFTQIEKDKSRTISAAFAFLVFIYFAVIWFVALLIKNYFFFQSQFDSSLRGFGSHEFEWLGWWTSLQIVFWSLLSAGGHLGFASWGLVDRITRILRAQSPDLSDDQEKMFQNIVEEVSVATGGMVIQPMIIPSMMLNACAYADGQAVAVIAVTKGLLEKLTRSQLEAVVGHEAAHVVSEDCQSTTIISAMFEIFGATLLAGRTALEGIYSANMPSDYRLRGGDWPKDYSTSDRGSGKRDGGGGGSAVLFFIIFVIVILFILWVVKNLASLMRMFISRQREYRADAIAVRLTRDPLSLAEALYIVGNRRHSLYEGADALQSMFIVNPEESSLNNQQNLTSDLFSTHPPLEERIKILLSMAHTDESVLTTALKTITDKEEQELLERQKIVGKAKGGLWYVQTPTMAWSGPHNPGALLAFDWLTPQTLVKKMGENTMLTVDKIENYMKEYRETLKNHPSQTCPACSGELATVEYEKVKILECQNCHGLLLKEEAVAVVLARKEKVFDSRIQGMARTLLNEKQLSTQDSTVSFESQRMYRCDQCEHRPRKMRRRLFNRFYPIEVDKCSACALTWFDKDELEIMQCMYEMRNAQA